MWVVLGHGSDSEPFVLTFTPFLTLAKALTPTRTRAAAHEGCSKRSYLVT